MGQYLTLPKIMAEEAHQNAFRMKDNGKLQVITPDINTWHPCISSYGFNMNQEINDMINTTNRLELWEWFQEYEPEKGFMWSNHDNIAAISSGLDNNNHSGASFGICMRQIQFIAQHSWEDWNIQNGLSVSQAKEDAKIQMQKTDCIDPGAHNVEF